MSSELTVFGYRIEDIIHSHADFKNNFILGEHICNGAQGSIYATSRNKARYREKFYLITKAINITGEFREENILKSVQEYILMRKLNMINISGLSYGLNQKELLFTMEMLEYSLSDAIYFNIDDNMHDFKCVHSDYGLKYLMLEVTSFLYSLHNIGFVHLDLKPDNIMYRNGANEKNLFYGNGFKVIDLGLTEYIANTNGVIKLDCFVGTKGYSSPEIYKNKRINYKTDIWSLAVVILFVLNGYNIFNNTSDKFDYDKNFINSHLMSLFLTNKINFKLYDLLSQMFEFDPNKRPSAKDILKHPYFDGVVFEGSDNQFYCYKKKITNHKGTIKTIKKFVRLTQKITVKNQ